VHAFDAGAAWEMLWKGAFVLGGRWGIAALRVLVIAGLAVASESGAASMAALLLAAALLPWGTGMASPLILASAIAFGQTGFSQSKHSALKGILYFFWPAFDPFFWITIPLSALSTQRPLRKDALLALFAILSPWCISPLIKGTLWTPLVAVVANHPAFAGAMPPSPFFFGVMLASALGFMACWENAGKRFAAGLAAFCGTVLRPMAPLPAVLALRSGAPAWTLAGVIPMALWLTLQPAAPPAPARAAALLARAPRGGYSLACDLGWRGEMAMNLRSAGASWQVAPILSSASLWNFRAVHRGLLLPPFQGNPEPEGEACLVRARYPKYADPAPLLKGWLILDAGESFALFVKASGPLKDWAEVHALKHYNPYGELPRDSEGAKQALSEALSILKNEPNFFEALRDCGRLEMDLGMADDSVDHLVRAASLRPSDDQVFNDLGAALARAGKNTEAAAAYQRSIALAPWEPLPRLNLAALYVGEGALPQAEAELRQLVKDRGGLPPARVMLAQVLRQEGRDKEADDVEHSLIGE
jgi:tetratricopeptide (TPR) repeat protein